jgi:hypothetical protein
LGTGLAAHERNEKHSAHGEKSQFTKTISISRIRFGLHGKTSKKAA